MDNIDIRRYWEVVWRRWWVLVIALLSLMLIALLVSRSTTPLYRASAKLLVQSGATPGILSSSDFEASRQLALILGDLVKTRPILESVIQELSLNSDPATLSKKISVTSGRSLIEIVVVDPDPQRAADIANKAVQTLIDDFRRRQFLQIAQFQNSLGEIGIVGDSSIIAAQASTMSSLSLVEAAEPPVTPYSPKTVTNVLVAGVAGLLIGLFAVFILEYFDDRIKSVDQFKSLTGLPVLGSVISYKNRGEQIITGGLDGGSHVTEAYKFLRANLEFSGLGADGNRSLMITSSGPSEGKTTTAINLAFTFAREGERVILVDSDLRKPGLSSALGLKNQENQKGLVDVILRQASLDEALVSIGLPGLMVLPAGLGHADSTQLLGSTRMKELVEELKRRAELVIFDTSPLLVVADPMVMLPLVDCVLLVVDAQRTGHSSVLRSVENLKHAKALLLGGVLNKVTARRSGEGYYYYDYYYYGSNGTSQQKKRSGLGSLLWAKRPRRRRKVGATKSDSL